jgi:hypothetical protein
MLEKANRHLSAAKADWLSAGPDAGWHMLTFTLPIEEWT